MLYNMVYNMVYNLVWMAAWCLHEIDREAPGLFTVSERIIQDFASEEKVYAKFIKELIHKCYTTHSSIVNRIGGK